MSTRRFPVLKLTHVIFGNVLRFCSIEELYFLSKLSRRTKCAIQQVLFRAEEVHLNIEHDSSSLRVKLQNDCEIEWKYGEGFSGSHTFGNVLETTWNDGNCDPKLKMAEVFRQMKELFRIEQITTLAICFNELNPSLQFNPILREIGTCQKVDIFLGKGIKTDDLEFFFSNVRIEDEFRIHANLSVFYTYFKPFSVAKTVIFGSGWNVHDRLQHRTLINANRVLFDKGLRPAYGFQNLFRVWKEGLLPNLQIIEHDGYSGNFQFLENVLRGLDAQTWDLEQENTLNMINFFNYAKLRKFPVESLQFQNAKDIIRTSDGVKASIIPATTLAHPDEFIFVVWSDWIPEEYRRV